MRKYFFRMVCLFLALFLIAACGTPIVYRSYEGAQRPSNEIAMLSVDRQIFVLSVDDKGTGLKGYQVGEKGVDLEIVPGLRKIQFTYSSMLQTTSSVSTTYLKKAIEVSYEFKAGRKYEIHYGAMGNSFSYELVDVTDGGAKKGMLATWGRL